MDHENLKYFQELHKLNGRQVRWYLKLQDYNFTLRHIPGKTNTKADILSRKDQVNTKEDNKDIQLLKEELWSRRTTAEITMIGRKTTAKECNVIKEIRKNSTREKKVVQALEKQDVQSTRLTSQSLCLFKDKSSLCLPFGSHY